MLHKKKKIKRAAGLDINSYIFIHKIHQNLQRKLFPQPSPVLLLWFHCVEEGKLYYIWPDGRTGAATYSTRRHKIN